MAQEASIKAKSSKDNYYQSLINLCYKGNAYCQDKVWSPHGMAGMPTQYLQALVLPTFQVGIPWRLRRKDLFVGACSKARTQHLSHDGREPESFHLHLLHGGDKSFSEQNEHLMI